MYTKFKYFILFLIVNFFTIINVSAENTVVAPNPGAGAGGRVGLVNPIKWDDIGSLFGAFMSQIRGLIALVAILAYFWVGWKYVSAMGDKTKITEAHKALKNVSIGVAIILGAEVITAVIQGTFASI